MRQNRFFASDSANRPRLIGVIGIIVSTLLFLSIAIYAFTARQSLLPKTEVHLPFIIPGLPTQPLVTCTTPEHAPGDSTDSITSGGLKRTFLVHLPPDYGVQSEPLVLLYHGYSWTSQIMEHNSTMTAESDRAGFVLVFPQAPYTGNPNVGMAGVQNYLNGWLERDKCDTTSNVFFQQGDVTGIEWTHCAPGVAVVHYRVSDGAHTWPGTPHTTHVIDAAVV